MGFCGRNLESAYFLLREATRGGGQGAAMRTLGPAVLESFARLPVAPPSAEGFRLGGGAPASQEGERFFLRALCECGRAMLRALEHERRLGRDRPGWACWCLGLADWLLGQRKPEVASRGPGGTSQPR